jgi:hypothetical protein
MKLPPIQKSEQETEAFCNECRYYQEYDELETDDIESPEDLTGICRRYPPAVFPGVSPTSVYPDVSGPTGWCGEFTPKG